MAHDVFISYSSKDKTTADAVCARLEARGIRCWIAPRDVRPGLPYGEEIIDAIQSCRLMVLVFSANANASPHIPKEIERAVSDGIPVIPLRVEAVTPAKSLDYFISSVHWLDALTPPLEQHLESLANTILTILPTRPPDPTQPRTPGAPVISVPVVTTSSSSSAVETQKAITGKKKTGLFISIGVAALVAIAVAGYLWFRPAETQSAAANQPSQPATPISPRASVVPADGDPIAGCWQWFNNVPITINADGSVIAGPFTAHWRNTDRSHHAYTITWPEAVDNLTLSSDGSTLTGGNQYGFSTTATRLGPGAGAIGMWSWHGGMVAIQPDGTFTAGPFRGRWRTTGANAYSLTWPKPVDNLTLSPDHQRLSGGNQFGIKTSGTRLANCGG